jgi:hypothetical protein
VNLLAQLGFFPLKGGPFAGGGDLLATVDDVSGGLGHDVEVVVFGKELKSLEFYLMRN